MNVEIQVTYQQNLREIYTGLLSEQKSISSKYFYDEEGSKIFDEITKLEEYYPTRTELMIMKNNIDDIVETVGSDFNFVEFGSGSSVKTRLLLRNLKDIRTYIPIDISEEHLYNTAEDLRNRFPGLNVFPVPGDYSTEIEIPDSVGSDVRRVGFFPGSTIGNFLPAEAEEFLARKRELLGDNGNLIIGFDLVKDTSVLETAYNDKKGVTARFNKNIMLHLNREYGFDFDYNAFEHKSVFNPVESRIEMYLVSNKDQVVSNGALKVEVKKGEEILTEYSHKYTIYSFTELVEKYFDVTRVWTDEKEYFAILYLSCT